MALADVAAAARAVLPASIEDTMVAIGGAETGGAWDNPPSSVDVASDNPYTCPAYSIQPAPFSFGTWQVNLQANRSLIAPMAGVTTPCGIADWIMASYVNAARAALAVYRSQGYGAWTTYRDGRYLAYLPAARAALGTAPTTSLVAVSPAVTTAPVSAAGARMEGVLVFGLLGVLLLATL